MSKTVLKYYGKMNVNEIFGLLQTEKAQKQFILSNLKLVCENGKRMRKQILLL